MSLHHLPDSISLRQANLMRKALANTSTFNAYMVSLRDLPLAKEYPRLQALLAMELARTAGCRRSVAKRIHGRMTMARSRLEWEEIEEVLKSGTRGKN